MRIEYCDILRDLHIALDEVTGSDAKEDDFATDTDTELRQAVKSAIEQLLGEVPDDLIDLAEGNSQPVTFNGSDNSCSIPIPTNYMRFSSLQFNSWKGALHDLTDPASDKAKMQRCKWTRGSIDKPVAILSTSGGNKVLLVYTVAGKEDALLRFSYVPKPEYQNAYVECGLHDEVYKVIVYRAAAIFLDTHREEAASKYYELSKVV